MDRLERATNNVLLYLTEPSIDTGRFKQSADTVLKKYLKGQKLHLWLENQMIVDKIWAKIDAKFDYLTT